MNGTPKPIRTKRNAAGSYQVSDGTLTVKVFDASRELGGYPKWIAAAEWDESLYTDWLETKGDAVFNATKMIQTERGDESMK